MSRRVVCISVRRDRLIANGNQCRKSGMEVFYATTLDAAIAVFSSLNIDTVYYDPELSASEMDRLRAIAPPHAQLIPMPY